MGHIPCLRSYKAFRTGMVSLKADSDATPDLLDFHELHHIQVRKRLSKSLFRNGHPSQNSVEKCYSPLSLDSWLMAWRTVPTEGASGASLKPAMR